MMCMDWYGCTPLWKVHSSSQKFMQFILSKMGVLSQPPIICAFPDKKKIPEIFPSWYIGTIGKKFLNCHENVPSDLDVSRRKWVPISSLQAPRRHRSHTARSSVNGILFERPAGLTIMEYPMS